MDAVKIESALKNAVIIFLAGRPGAGKQDTGDLVLKRLPNSVRVIVSEALDHEIAEMPGDSADKKTIMAFKEAGEMVPDEYVIPLVFRIIAKLYSQGYTRIILDGFPRTGEQDTAITTRAAKFLMCYLDIDVELALERMEARGREGETSEKCQKRQRVFEEHTLPIIERFAVLHPLRYCEIDSGKFGREERADLIVARIEELEAAMSEAA